jgi:hypothetical protein
MSGLALIAAESGAPWVEWADDWAGVDREIVVVLQQKVESPEAFQERVQHSLERAVRSGHRLCEVAVLGRSSEETDAAQHRLHLAAALSRAAARFDLTPRVSIKVADTGSCHA